MTVAELRKLLLLCGNSQAEVRVEAGKAIWPVEDVDDRGLFIVLQAKKGEHPFPLQKQKRIKAPKEAQQLF